MAQILVEKPGRNSGLSRPWQGWKRRDLPLRRAWLLRGA
jgi:hypothetical protein